MDTSLEQPGDSFIIKNEAHYFKMNMGGTAGNLSSLTNQLGREFLFGFMLIYEQEV